MRRAGRHARRGRARIVTLRMSCSCFSTACTSSCSSQRNSSSCGTDPAVTLGPGAPPARPLARAPHQHGPLRRRRCHHGGHGRRPLPSALPAGSCSGPPILLSSVLQSSRPPAGSGSAPAPDWLSGHRPAPTPAPCSRLAGSCRPASARETLRSPWNEAGGCASEAGSDRPGTRPAAARVRLAPAGQGRGRHQPGAAARGRSFRVAPRL